MSLMAHSRPGRVGGVYGGVGVFSVVALDAWASKGSMVARIDR